MRVLLRTSLLVLVMASVLVATVAAQETAPAPTAAPAGAVSGTMVGNGGGAYITMKVTLPADTDVTLKLDHWPCMTGDAIGVNVWTAAGLLAQGSEATACTQEASFNSGTGGPAEIQVYNYLDGVGTWYSLTATGITLPGAMAPAAAAKEEKAEAPAAEKAEAAKVAAPAAPAAAAKEEKTEAPAVAKAEAPTAPAAKIMVENQSLFGNDSGAFKDYPLAVKKGQDYEVTLTYGLDRGGTWPAVGFNVWCPSGWAAQGESIATNQISATFMADADATCQVQVYNYYTGMTMFYSLLAGPVAQ